MIWNWYWNCDTNQGLPAAPVPPAGATTIVLNWHWTCDTPPPPLDVAGITVCTSCNIVISVRVASPGDTGDVTQAIVASTAAAALNVANTIQEAFQAAIPPPAVQQPAAAVSSPEPASTYRVDEGPVIAPEATWASDDPRRHGAPTSYGGRQPQASADERSQSRVRAAAGITPFGDVPAGRVVALQQWILQHPDLRRRVVVSATATRRLPAPPAPPPPAPVPAALSAGIAAPNGAGVGVVSSLASGLVMLLLYAIFSALRVRPAVPRARSAGANPHPPG